MYKIDNEKCIKLFKKKRSCSDELHSLLISQSYSCFPKLYSYGDKYIVREYVHGTPLDEFLLHNPLTNDICDRLMKLYFKMKYVGFKRLDSALFHIFVSNYGELKIIDTAKAMKRKYICPRIILSGLSDLNYKDEFLDFVKKEYPDTYEMWMKDGIGR